MNQKIEDYLGWQTTLFACNDCITFIWDSSVKEIIHTHLYIIGKQSNIEETSFSFFFYPLRFKGEKLESA